MGCVPLIRGAETEVANAKSNLILAEISELTVRDDL